MSELALRLIAENKKTRATFLDLGNCGLTEVPDEIGELVWLEGLSFASRWWDGDQSYESQNSAPKNSIALLNAGLGRLKNLKKLYLNGEFDNSSSLADINSLIGLSDLQLLDVSNTQIFDLRPLLNLNRLQWLDLSRTNVAELSSLSGLKSLKWLSLHKTQVSNLNPLAYLVKLQQLYISRTDVTDLCPLASLTHLQELNISLLLVSDLSPLKNLNSLEWLRASDTQVSNITPLKNLNNLQGLDISDTQVSNLNPLKNLIKLRELNVSNTQVNDLSPLACLNQLQELNAFSTQIFDLSPIANLKNLQALYIASTRVADLSPLLPLIRNNFNVKWGSNSWVGNGIFIEDCPLINPPVTIVQQGNAAILEYFNDKEIQGVDHLYEAKLLLVGEGGSGKTSLLRRLYQPEANLPEENETTKGIEIHHHEFNVSDSRYPNGRRFRLNVWDFSGQEIYHATHQFFLTKRSLYVLLDDTRKDHKTVHDEGFKYWLEVVDFLGGHSPVLIFQNEKGDRSKAIDEAGIKGKFDNVREFHRGNLESPAAADSLRKAIEYFAQSLPHIGEELPARWLDIRREIEQLAQQHATIDQDQYFELYRKHLPFERVKALHLSRYLHDLGVFLHFQDDRLLKRIVILQNRWATEAVFKVLDDEAVKAQLGRFTGEDCARLWQDSDYAYMHDELIALMQKFELCYLLPDAKPETWLAPQLLPPSKPTELNDWAQAGDLVLRYRYEFLPKGMIGRLMVRQHHLVPHPELGWLNGVLFERDDTQLLAEIASSGKEIVLRVRGFERKELLSVVAADLDALNKTFDGLSDKVEKLIPCTCYQCQHNTKPEFFKQNYLLKRKKEGKLTARCPESDKDISISNLLDGIQTREIPAWGKVESLPKIFISYSRHDNVHKESLLKQLSPLQNDLIIWDDKDLLPGEQWDERIKKELLRADIVLYLVSADSMATDYIQNVELPLIEQRCQDGKCKLVPIIVRSCYWEKSDFAKYNALPDKGRPITTWDDKDEAWTEVVKGIKKLLN